jgi:hypothetical protein
MSSAMRFTSAAPAKSPFGHRSVFLHPRLLSPFGVGTVTSNCAANNFTVSVNISSLGTATGANITASPGGTLYTNVGLGTYVCGPFTLGTPVTLSVVHSTSAACTNVLGVFNPTPTCTTLTNGDLHPGSALPGDPGQRLLHRDPCCKPRYRSAGEHHARLPARANVLPIAGADHRAHVPR